MIDSGFVVLAIKAAEKTWLLAFFVSDKAELGRLK